MSTSVARATAVARVYLLATRKTTALATNDAKYIAIVNLLDQLQKDWQNEKGVDWNSLWQLFTVGATVAQDTDEYTFPTTIRKVSQRENDSVRVLRTNGVTYDDFDFVRPEKLYENTGNDVCTHIGTKLKFAVKFPSGDPRIGGTIYIPGYRFVTAITTATDPITVDVDNPDWLYYAAAAEFIRNDFVRRSQYPNLVARANELMEKMKEDNEDQVEESSIIIDSDLDPNNQSGAWS